jgi:hypothetical protein
MGIELAELARFPGHVDTLDPLDPLPALTMIHRYGSRFIQIYPLVI